MALAINYGHSTFIGLKMLIVALGVHIPIWFSLVFVAVVLLGSVAASLLIPAKPETTIEVDLPPDYDLPLGEELPEPPQVEATKQESGDVADQEETALRSGK